MRIIHVNIENFRKLKSVKIDFEDMTTILVGANNCGKTSAILALDYFLNRPNSLRLKDITIDNLSAINEIGERWETRKPEDDLEAAIEKDKEDLIALMPSLDVWLDVPSTQIHQVVAILPTLSWKGGTIGVRLQYTPKSIDDLQHQYLAEREKFKAAVIRADASKFDVTEKLWPKTLCDFLDKRLSLLELCAYPLDPQKSHVRQSLPPSILPFDGNPLLSLIKVSQTGAQRGLTDNGTLQEVSGSEEAEKKTVSGRKLSSQLRGYYNRHLKPVDGTSDGDLQALAAILGAEKSFDETLSKGFEKPFLELKKLGYPGMLDPNIKVAAAIRVQDTLNHESAVQYSVGNDNHHHLPEDYVGLGFQNLISMTFDLMSYRDNWMKVHGEATAAADAKEIEPIHLVLIEEPEAHLHAQVQQVFIRRAYDVLTDHELLKEDDNARINNWQTQLLISTHSSHIAYEAEFCSLRYFRRKDCPSGQAAQLSEVVNLSDIFAKSETDPKKEETKFVAKYLRATSCDLLFADAAIFIEGQAERLLLPEFIKSHFPNLHSRYYSIIELGGSHAHKFKELIEALGVVTLIICDLDSVKNTKSIAPKRKDNQVTANSVLKSWHPKKDKIDELLDLCENDQKVDGKGIFVTYQKELLISEGEKQIPRTFEDALILSNPEALKQIEGKGTTKKVRALVEEELTGEELSSAIFELVRDAKKGDFALDCLVMQKSRDNGTLNPPEYIKQGLGWLDKELAPKEEILKSEGEK